MTVLNIAVQFILFNNILLINANAITHLNNNKVMETTPQKQRLLLLPLEAPKQKTPSRIRSCKKPLNFDSPRTSAAASLLGITYEDCIERTIDDFIVPGVDRKIAELRYNYHKTVIEDKLQNIRKMREEVSKAEQKQLLKQCAEEPARKQPNPAVELWREKANLTSKEKDKLAKLLKKSWSATHFFETAKPMSKHVEKPPLKEVRDKAKESLDRINANKYIAPRNSVERLLSTGRECCGISFVKRYSVQRSSLNKSIGSRILTAKNSVWEQKAAQADSNWEKSQEALARIEQKLKEAAEKVEKALFTKSLLAANVGRNTNEMRVNFHKRNLSNAAQRQDSYILKANKIDEYKRKKELMLTQGINQLKEKWQEKKISQTNRLNQKKYEESAYLEELRQKVNAKSSRDNSVTTLEHKEYWKEMQRLNLMVQKEKIDRIKRIELYKRKQLLNLCTTAQGSKIIADKTSRGSSEGKSTGKVYEYATKLLEKTRSEQVIRLLNKKLDLGLDLNSMPQNYSIQFCAQ
eukprot:TRINITY_DN71118_c1_g1_i1.p1 TRINITY_DN71118_c1_g1~~TRINITY_DN71118_c1_g1_i1.p1  ORF type:complete len:521 (-),score=67.08 TRINITY_DN71118_c1_g1_i1:63-1625(-)